MGLGGIQVFVVYDIWVNTSLPDTYTSHIRLPLLYLILKYYGVIGTSTYKLWHLDKYQPDIYLNFTHKTSEFIFNIRVF